MNTFTNNTNSSSSIKSGIQSSLNYNNLNNVYNQNLNCSTKHNTNYISNHSNSNNYLNSNNYIFNSKDHNNLSKSNYISNIASNSNLLNNNSHIGTNTSNINNSINFTSYVKSDNYNQNSINKSNEMISPKNTFTTQLCPTNRKLKDFINLYTKKKFMKGSKNVNILNSISKNNIVYSNSIKEKEDILTSNYLNTNSNSYNNINSSSKDLGKQFFLSEKNIQNENYKNKKKNFSNNNLNNFTHSCSTTQGQRLQSLKYNNTFNLKKSKEKLIDIE